MHKILPYLKDYGLTVKQLAELCSVTTRTIHNWDKGMPIKDINKEKLLKQIIPDFEPEPRINLYETNLRPPQINIERDSDLPKITIISKSSRGE